MASPGFLEYSSCSLRTGVSSRRAACWWEFILIVALTIRSSFSASWSLTASRDSSSSGFSPSTRESSICTANCGRGWGPSPRPGRRRGRGWSWGRPWWGSSLSMWPVYSREESLSSSHSCTVTDLGLQGKCSVLSGWWVSCSTEERARKESGASQGSQASTLTQATTIKSLSVRGERWDTLKEEYEDSLSQVVNWRYEDFVSLF